MIYADTTETLHIFKEGIAYCAYCGKEIKPSTEIDHYERSDYYKCNCENALSEIKIDKEISNLKREIESLKKQLPSPKFRTKTKIIEVLEELKYNKD